MELDDVGAMMKRARKAAGDFGKFYTPPELSRLIARLAAGRDVKRVLDPACGCGSLLYYAREVLGDAFYVGQEIDAGSCELARKNLEGFRCEIVNCDSLADSTDWTEKFDAVLANPPFSVRWTPKPDARFETLAPKSKADLAFVQHGLYWLRDGGQAAYVLSFGALSRGGAEEKIRASFLPFVRAVVALPGKLFDSTGVATCLVLFRKTPSDAPVYFLEAPFHTEGKRNVVDDDVCELVGKRRIEKGRSALAEKAAIAKNGCNLTPNAWIEKPIDREPSPYDGLTFEQLIEDGEARTKRLFADSMKLYAEIRKTMGYEYNPDFLDFDVERLETFLDAGRLVDGGARSRWSRTGVLKETK